jgi:hypothetical protein
MQARSPKLLEQHAPFAKLLLRATHELMKQPQYTYEGPAYRGLKLALNAELKGKFDTYKTSFVVGSLTTFPAFTSVSLDDKVANGFGDRVLFQFTRVRGVRIRALSQVPEEAEVLVPPPSVFRIVAVAMFHGSLVITLERVDSPLAYLLQPAPALPATHAKTSFAAGGGAAASSGDLEEELQALVAEMTKLQLGLKKACVTFARCLANEGVMTLERLRPLPSAKARTLLQKAGMKELQVNAVLQAFCPPAPQKLLPLVPSPAPAPVPAFTSQPTAQQKVATPPNALRPTCCLLRDVHFCRLLLLLALQAKTTLFGRRESATFLWCKTT